MEIRQAITAGFFCTSISGQATIYCNFDQKSFMNELILRFLCFKMIK